MSYTFRAFDGPRDWEWVKSRIRISRVEDTCGIVAENTKGSLVGAAIFDNFLYASAQVSLILETPMLIRAGFLDAAYHFLFETCGRRICYALVAANNLRSIRLSERVGYVKKMTIPDGFKAGVDFWVYELHRDNFYRTRAS